MRNNSLQKSACVTESWTVRMKAIFLLVCLIGGVSYTTASGRAFPVESENYAVQVFGMKWDPTNYLVDLAGEYAGCEFIGQSGNIDIYKRTKDNKPIQGIRDYGPSSGNDVNSVNQDIRPILDRWSKNRPTLFRYGSRFGCSVRPGCNGQVSVACLISGALPPIGTPPPAPPPGPSPLARAFTRNQYSLTENWVGKTWDRSHAVENIVGQYTKCSMIDRPVPYNNGPVLYSNDNNMEQATREASRALGGTYVSQWGYERNAGKTEPAMHKILTRFKIEQKWNKNAKIGCAVIPDCMRGSEMDVLVACLFQIENYMW